MIPPALAVRAWDEVLVVGPWELGAVALAHAIILGIAAFRYGWLRRRP